MRASRTALAVTFAIALVVSGCSGDSSFPASDPTTTGTAPSPAVVADLLPRGVRPPMLLTYFFYWYDADTGRHLKPSDGLPLHLPPVPKPSWHSTAWFRRQLIDMADAGIDVALPVYWGDRPDEPWSAGGLPYLVAARHALVATGGRPPAIGMFFDTSTIRGTDLTTDAGINAFYGVIASFFRAIPENDWARAGGRPIVWLFLPQNNRFDQRVFDETYLRFTQDFGVRPYIVRATGWDCPNTGVGCAHPIRTDASYVWGTAQDGMQATSLVASAGPGYDERQIPGRRGVYVDRAGGAYYRTNLTAAVQSQRPFVAIETWNEIHEASAICQTVEYGRQYIDLTREIVDAQRRRTP